ncbi:DUF883 family protein [Candidatus Sumerlaeota bacterium]|nr:DUF883 family protein [Candidatus Sumerlaeota bacterium]
MKSHADEKVENAESFGRRMASGANDLMESAREHAGDYKDRAKDILHEANNTSLADVEKKVGSYIKANPGRSLLTAAAAGFVLGFLVSRK